MAVFITGGQAAERVNYVGWLQTDGNAYIDTNYKPTSNTRVVCEFQMNNPSGWQALFGASDTVGNTNSVAFWYTPSNGFAHYYGTEKSAAFGVVTEGIGTSTQNIIDCNKNVATLSRGDKSYTVTNATAKFNCSQPIYLFGVNYGGSFMYPNEGAKIMSYDIYENDVLMQSLRPCYDPDGVPAYYDSVAKEYHYNAGSGEFTAGEDETEKTYYWGKYSVVQDYETKATSKSGSWSWASVTVGYASELVGSGASFKFDNKTTGRGYVNSGYYSDYPYIGVDLNDGSLTNQAFHVWRAYGDGNIDTDTVYTRVLADAKGDFISTVASTDPNAYPENGVQNGYWYVKIAG